MDDTVLDTVIVGGGQAGLALAHHLKREGRRFVVVEAADRLGDSWRRRWDSLTLFTPRRYDALPGLPFPGDPDGCPGKDEVADYLEAYATSGDLPVLLAAPVLAARGAEAGHFTVETPRGTLVSRQVVVAAGAFTGPAVPPWAQALHPDVAQLHSSAYRSPAALPEGEVVVVGAGNTGVQIAAELAAAGRTVSLSVSSLSKALPQRVLGRDLFWWLDRLGVMDVGSDTRIGRRLRTEEAIVGTDLDAVFRQVRRLPRAEGAAGHQVLLAGGERRSADVVVWATGYRPQYPWLQVPVLDATGAPVHRQGLTDVPGLAFLGLPWQRNRGSALLGWVGRDAAVLAAQLGHQLRTTSGTGHATRAAA